MLILSPAQKENLKKLGIETAEDLERQILTADWGWLLEIYIAMGWCQEEQKT